jgi:hypothetical protein
MLVCMLISFVCISFVVGPLPHLYSAFLFSVLCVQPVCRKPHKHFINSQMLMNLDKHGQFYIHVLVNLSQIQPNSLLFYSHFHILTNLYLTV